MPGRRGALAQAGLEGPEGACGKLGGPVPPSPFLLPPPLPAKHNVHPRTPAKPLLTLSSSVSPPVLCVGCGRCCGDTGDPGPFVPGSCRGGRGGRAWGSLPPLSHTAPRQWVGWSGAAGPGLCGGRVAAGAGRVCGRVCVTVYMACVCGYIALYLKEKFILRSY